MGKVAVDPLDCRPGEPWDDADGGRNALALPASRSKHCSAAEECAKYLHASPRPEFVGGGQRNEVDEVSTMA
jgi:hypothetical protein